jgi:hypothetical protein
MIQKAIDILKMRWPEVVLIVVLHTAIMVFGDEYMRSYQAMTPERTRQEPFWPDFFLAVGIIAFMVVILKLYLGFLKTAATDGPAPQEPMQLLRIGRPYFIRMLVFQLFWQIAVSILTIPIIGVLGGAIWQTEDATGIPDWFVRLGTLLGMLVLMKPLFLIPARILVYEDTVFGALSAIWRYRLGRMDDFIFWALAGFGAIAAMTLLTALAAAQTPLYYVLSTVHFLVLNVVLLGLTLAVVLRLQQELETQQAHVAERPVQE